MTVQGANIDAVNHCWCSGKSSSGGMDSNLSAEGDMDSKLSSVLTMLLP